MLEYRRNVIIQVLFSYISIWMLLNLTFEVSKLSNPIPIDGPHEGIHTGFRAAHPRCLALLHIVIAYACNM